ncbi:MAG: hypothetical protein AAF432_03960 [Planctomycetota bacterium]
MWTVIERFCDVVELLVAIDDTKDAWKDGKREWRRGRLLILLIGFAVAIGGAMLIGVITGRTFWGVLAGLVFFAFAITIMVVRFRRVRGADEAEGGES